MCLKAVALVCSLIKLQIFAMVSSLIIMVKYGYPEDPLGRLTTETLFTRLVLVDGENGAGWLIHQAMQGGKILCETAYRGECGKHFVISKNDLFQ